MQPYLNSLISLLSQGSDIKGIDTDGSQFVLPKLLMAFTNDGQIAELVAALGVLDDEEPLQIAECRIIRIIFLHTLCRCEEQWL